MKISAGRWLIVAFMLIALNILGSGMALYADALSGKSAQRASCPLPSADSHGKEKKTVATIVKERSIPDIDRRVPVKTETATFGLG